MIDDPAAYDVNKQDDQQYHPQDEPQYYQQYDQQDGFARQNSGSFHGYAVQHDTRYDDERTVSDMYSKGTIDVLCNLNFLEYNYLLKLSYLQETAATSRNLVFPFSLSIFFTSSGSFRREQIAVPDDFYFKFIETRQQ